MGCYLNNFGEEACNKIETLILCHGALRQGKPHYLDPDSGKIAVCIRVNAIYDSAVVICCQKDFDFHNDPDPRQTTWLCMDLDAVKKIAPGVTQYIKEGKEDA